MTFYNTTHLTNPQLAAEAANAQQQEEAIFVLFSCYPDNLFTPWDVHDIYPIFPITSVRRAMTNLTNAGRLIHTAHRRNSGPYNKVSGCWTLHPQYRD